MHSRRTVLFGAAAVLLGLATAPSGHAANDRRVSEPVPGMYAPPKKGRKNIWKHWGADPLVKPKDWSDLEKIKTIFRKAAHKSMNMLEATLKRGNPNEYHRIKDNLARDRIYHLRMIDSLTPEMVQILRRRDIPIPVGVPIREIQHGEYSWVMWFGNFEPLPHVIADRSMVKATDPDRKAYSTGTVTRFSVNGPCGNCDLQLLLAKLCYPVPKEGPEVVTTTEGLRLQKKPSR